MADILVVDDQLSSRKFLVEQLTGKGHKLAEAGNGEEALALARKARPDLIIADVLMPAMDGYELAHQLRAAPALAAVKIILCTSAYHQHEARKLAKSCGVTQLLLKPFEAEHVLKVVSESLGEKPPPSQTPDEDFHRDHLRLVTDKLYQTTSGLTFANQRLAELIDVHLQLAAETEPRQLLEILCKAARNLLGSKCASAGFTKQPGNDHELFVARGMDAGKALALENILPQCDGIRSLLRARRSLRLSSLSGNPKTMGLPAEYPAVHSFLGVPIVAFNRPSGWLILTNKLGADAFNAEDERIASILAAQFGRTQENRILFADLKLKAGELEKEIVERKKVEREIRELNTKLEQRVRDRTAALENANHELEAFSFSVSHDLRAPLRHIHGFADLLKLSSETELSEKSGHFLEEISASATQMSQLVDDLLDFSRMARAELSRQSVDLNTLTQTALERLAPETKDRKIIWKTGALPQVQGDPAMLSQALINLLSNAIKYTRPRDPAEIEIGSSTNRASGETVIFIRDNGVGFDMQFADKLFGVFQRLHLKEQFEGTGIGLANVRRIINRHGGRTWAESKPDAGATFYFSLPGETASCEPSAIG